MSLKENQRLQAEVNGLREVVENQRKFIDKIKKMFAEYSGEGEHWKKLRERRGYGDKSS